MVAVVVVKYFERRTVCAAIIRKYLSVRVLTEKAMGDAKYMPNPCVMICPFAGPRCVHGSFRMNGACKPSQLYSHWQHMHPGNPAARQLEVRWRQAIKNKGITLAQLDVCAPVQMEGDEEAGYEPLRTAPTGGDDHFPHTFSLGSTALYAWLQATDTV